MPVHLNIEIKAKCPDPISVRNYLSENQADYRGKDEQTDTYFNVQRGRLKLREGNIENNLIYYERPDQAGPRHSDFQLVKVEDRDGLKQALTSALGIKVIVRKSREIYYIGNVKFHIDEVPGLGHFVEIEASNIQNPSLAAGTLKEQCEHYLQVFQIRNTDLIELSYSDMMMRSGE